MATTKKCPNTGPHSAHEWMWRNSEGLMFKRYCNGVRSKKDS